MLSILLFAVSALLLAPEAASQSEYYLRSKDSYVAPYHIGAGLNDVVLSDRNVAGKGYLNGTKQLFDFGSDFTWGMVLTSYPADTEWKYVRINAGAGTEGFRIDENDQLQCDAENFHGWMACLWSHNEPQLFWLTRPDITFPGECYLTELEVEYI